METDDIDIYDDLPEFDLGQEMEKLRSRVRELEGHIQNLESNYVRQEIEIAQMKKSHEILKVNISELYLTAKREIDRKNKVIDDLRADRDNILFRKKQYGDPNFNKRNMNFEDKPVCKKAKLSDEKSIGDTKNREVRVKYNNRDRIDDKDGDRDRDHNRHRFSIFKQRDKEDRNKPLSNHRHSNNDHKSERPARETPSNKNKEKICSNNSGIKKETRNKDDMENKTNSSNDLRSKLNKNKPKDKPGKCITIQISDEEQDEYKNKDLKRKEHKQVILNDDKTEKDSKKYIKNSNDKEIKIEYVKNGDIKNEQKVLQPKSNGTDKMKPENEVTNAEANTSNEENVEPDCKKPAEKVKESADLKDAKLKEESNPKKSLDIEKSKKETKLVNNKKEDLDSKIKTDTISTTKENSKEHQKSSKDSRKQETTEGEKSKSKRSFDDEISKMETKYANEENKPKSADFKDKKLKEESKSKKSLDANQSKKESISKRSLDTDQSRKESKSKRPIDAEQSKKETKSVKEEDKQSPHLKEETKSKRSLDTEKTTKEITCVNDKKEELDSKKPIDKINVSKDDKKSSKDKKQRSFEKISSTKEVSKKENQTEVSKIDNDNEEHQKEPLKDKEEDKRRTRSNTKEETKKSKTENSKQVVIPLEDIAVNLREKNESAVVKRKSNEKPVTFKNILTKKKLDEEYPELHLTHDGEIPILHLEEDHFKNAPLDGNLQDRNILNLIDAMNITGSALECKFKNASDENINTETLNATKEHSNDGLSFTNSINKVTSTPVTNEKSCNESTVVDSTNNSKSESSINNSNPIAPAKRKRRRVVMSFIDD